jgi:hypothetical protein
MDPEAIRMQHRRVAASTADAVWGGMQADIVREAAVRHVPVPGGTIPDLLYLNSRVARNEAGSELAALIIEQAMKRPRQPDEVLRDRLYNLKEKDNDQL